MIVGLDLGFRKTGCVAVSDKVNKFVSLLIKPQKTGTGIENIAFIGEEVLKFVKKVKPVMVVIEGQSWAGKGKIGSLGELHGVVKYLLWKEGYSFEVISPLRARKIVLGKGYNRKGMVKEELKRIFKVQFDNLDIMDAWVVAVSYLQQKKRAMISLID